MNRWPVLAMLLVLFSLTAGAAAGSHDPEEPFHLTLGPAVPGTPMDVTVTLQNPTNATVTAAMSVSFRSVADALRPDLALPTLRDERVLGPQGTYNRTFQVPVRHTAPVTVTLWAKVGDRRGWDSGESRPQTTLIFDGPLSFEAGADTPGDLAFTLEARRTFLDGRLHLLPAKELGRDDFRSIHPAPGAPLLESIPGPGAGRVVMADGDQQEFAFTWTLPSAARYPVFPAIEEDGILHVSFWEGSRWPHVAHINVTSTPTKLPIFVAWVPAAAAAALVIGGWRLHARRTP